MNKTTTRQCFPNTNTSSSSHVQTSHTQTSHTNIIIIIMDDLERFLDTPYDQVSRRVRNMAHTELQRHLEPLTVRKISHFNFSSVLFIEGPFHPEQCIPEHTFRQIVYRQCTTTSSSSIGSISSGGGGNISSSSSSGGLEPLWSQLLSVMFVAGERCRESVSPRAQLSLANGIVLLARMLHLYESMLNLSSSTDAAAAATDAIGEGSNATDTLPSSSSLLTSLRVLPPAFTADFYRQMTRLLVEQTGDEKVYHPRVVLWSNRLTAYLFKSRLYGPLFLGYLFANGQADETAMQWVFDACYPRLLRYEVTPHGQVRQGLTYAYSIMWSLLSYNGHDNPIQHILSKRSDPKRLVTLRTLLMTHVQRDGSDSGQQQQQHSPMNDPLCLQSLQMLVNLCMYNAEFRRVFVDRFVLHVMRSCEE